MNSNLNTLYYDGNCGLCSHEIKLLNRLKNSELALIDIHKMNDKELELLGVSRVDLLSVMHLKKANHKNTNDENSEHHWLTGLDATAEAWGHTPFGWVFAILRWPLVRIIADKLYYSWAKQRACKLGYM